LFFIQEVIYYGIDGPIMRDDNWYQFGNWDSGKLKSLGYKLGFNFFGSKVLSFVEIVTET
jgi:hypothetical protein